MPLLQPSTIAHFQRRDGELCSEATESAVVSVVKATSQSERLGIRIPADRCVVNSLFREKIPNIILHR